MSRQKQAGGWESTLLAVALAVTGTMFFYDKICWLVRSGVLSVHRLDSFAPRYLLIVAVGLILADYGAFRGSEERGQNARKGDPQ